MNQFSLLEPPIARRSDPETSKVAAAELEQSGRRAAHQELLLSLIREQPGLTAMEYADRLYRRGLHWYQAYQVANKRMHDLEANARIVVSGERECRVTRHKARTWVAA